MKAFLPLVAVLLVLFAGGAALGITYNSPNVDGEVLVDPLDWDENDLAADDPDTDCRYYPSDGDCDAIYVTWDADSLYVGFKTTNGPGGFGNGYVLFIDTDAQAGITGATDFTDADFYARKITFSTMGADVVMGGWSFETPFDVRHCTDPTSTTPVSEFHTAYDAVALHVEAAISWNGLYGLGRGTVPNGTIMRFIAAVVGGDGTGAYDAVPTSSTGVESNPATPFDATTDLDIYFEAIVDGNLDGVPDEGFISPAEQKTWGWIKRIFR